MAPAGTSTYSSLPSAASVTGLPALSVTFTPVAATSEGRFTEALSALVRTVIGPSLVPAGPDTAAGSRLSEALGSSRFWAFSSSQSASFSAAGSTAVTSTPSE